MIGHRPPRQMEMLIGEPEAPSTRTKRLLNKIDTLVDWTPIPRLAAESFSDIGRPSIDPVVMVKMMLVGYLLGIESDRKLVEECSDRWSIREFLRYGLSESLPTHASFTNWRQRLGSEFFRDVLHEVVRQCVAHGVVLSEARTVDGTSVSAQACVHGPKVPVPPEREVDEYLESYAAGDEAGLPVKEMKWINTHDSEARLQRKGHEKADFRYNASFCACAETGLITDATATALESPTTMVAHVWRDPYPVTELAADSLYDAGESLAAVQDRGVTCYVPERDRNPTKLLSSKEFSYDAEADVYICPEGHILKHSRYREDRHLHYYTARILSCRGCPRKAACTEAARRTVTRTDHASALERTVRRGGRYRYLMSRRRVNEHLNNMGKRDHCLSRARGLGVEALRIQAALTAVAIDLMKLLRWPTAVRSDGKAGRSGRGLALLARLSRALKGPVWPSMATQAPRGAH